MGKFLAHLDPDKVCKEICGFLGSAACLATSEAETNVVLRVWSGGVAEVNQWPDSPVESLVLYKHDILNSLRLYYSPRKFFDQDKFIDIILPYSTVFDIW